MMKSHHSPAITDPAPARDQDAPSVEAERLLAQLPGFVFRLEHEGDRLHFSYASPGSLSVCGITPETLLATEQDFLSLIDPHDLPAFHASLQASVTAGTWNWEGRLRTSQGPKWVNIRAQTKPLGRLKAESVGIMLNVSQSHLRESHLRDVSAELRGMAVRFESIRELERARLARDLHDDLGQILTALKMDLASLHSLLRRQAGDAGGEQAKLFDSMDRLIDAAADAGRRVAAELRPSVLDLGLGPALEWLADQHRARYAAKVHCQTRGAPAIGELLAAELFRIAQEALTNIARHAGAGQVWLRLHEQDGRVCLEIADDGRGFAGAEPVPGRATFGLRGMRERAMLMDGSFWIGPAPQGGAMVKVCLPHGNPDHA